MLTRDPLTGKVMRDSHADVAEQLFGLGRRKRHGKNRRVNAPIAAMPRPSYSAPVASEPFTAPRPIAQRAVQQEEPESSIMPSEDYNGQEDESVQGVPCCGGYLISHATEPNIYPYENPGTRVSQLRNDRRNDVMGPGKSRNLTFEDRPPKHPPTYAQALQTRMTLMGVGHRRNGGYLPFERGGVGMFEGLQSGLTIGLVGVGAYLASDFIPAPFGTVAKVGGIGIALLGLAKIFSGDEEAPVKTFTPIPEGGYKLSGKIVSPAEGGKVGRDSFLGSSWPLSVQITNDGEKSVTVNLEVKSIERAGWLAGGTKTVVAQKQVTLAPHVPTTVKIDVPLAFFSYLTSTTAEIGVTVGGKYLANVKNVTIGI